MYVICTYCDVRHWGHKSLVSPIHLLQLFEIGPQRNLQLKQKGTLLAMHILYNRDHLLKVFGMKTLFNRFYPKSKWFTKHLLFDIFWSCTAASKSEAVKSTVLYKRWTYKKSLKFCYRRRKNVWIYGTHRFFDRSKSFSNQLKPW